MEVGGNEGMGEGWLKTVDVIVMPTIVAFATTHSRKKSLCMRAGGAPCRLCHRIRDNNIRSNFFCGNQMISTSTPP
jgi:hypothetical protein